MLSRSLAHAQLPQTSIPSPPGFCCPHMVLLSVQDVLEAVHRADPCESGVCCPGFTSRSVGHTDNRLLLRAVGQYCWQLSYNKAVFELPSSSIFLVHHGFALQPANTTSRECHELSPRRKACTQANNWWSGVGRRT